MEVYKNRQEEDSTWGNNYFIQLEMVIAKIHTLLTSVYRETFFTIAVHTSVLTDVPNNEVVFEYAEDRKTVV